MSLERTAEFIAKVGEDRELQAQLEQIDTAKELIRFAQEQGYEVTQEDWETVSSAMESQSDQLSEDQLESVAGGIWGGFPGGGCFPINMPIKPLPLFSKFKASS